jgi:hypothetical protein
MKEALDWAASRPSGCVSLNREIEILLPVWLLDNSHHNYASKLTEAIWSDNEVIQKLQTSHPLTMLAQE